MAFEFFRIEKKAESFHFHIPRRGLSKRGSIREHPELSMDAVVNYGVDLRRGRTVVSKTESYDQFFLEITE